MIIVISISMRPYLESHPLWDLSMHLLRALLSVESLTATYAFKIICVLQLNLEALRQNRRENKRTVQGCTA